MLIPPWALLLSFWLHMLATVVWIGGLAALAIIVLPTMRRSLKPAEFSSWLRALNRRLDPLGWLSLGLLTFTGLIQMEANPNYTGLLAVSNLWSQAIFIKHIFFIGMILASAYMTWVMSPAIQHAALMRTRGRRDKSVQTWQARLQQLITVNLILGVLVLVFTALARIS
jgi:uncharacterized membrane protein